MAPGLRQPAAAAAAASKLAHAMRVMDRMVIPAVNAI
jgi:hypothetical protein